MKALVVYESMYGNTAAIGGAIGAALHTGALDVDVHPISQIAPEDTGGFDLIVVGGPTHAHGMSHASTRKAGASDEKNTFPEPTLVPGIREWLSALPEGEGRFAAAFDTRFDKPAALTGSAARGIARRLRHRGYHLIAPPESFFVTTENTLEDGQMTHAATWGGALAERTRSGLSYASRRTA